MNETGYLRAYLVFTGRKTMELEKIILLGDP
jgi:hypothetical protein